MRSDVGSTYCVATVINYCSLFVSIFFAYIIKILHDTYAYENAAQFHKKRGVREKYDFGWEL